MDGRGIWKRYLLKPIDKVPQGGMSNYPGCNESERRSSLVKVYVHWSSLSIVGEDKILFLTLAEKEKNSGGVSAATRIERGAINWGTPPCP